MREFQVEEEENCKAEYCIYLLSFQFKEEKKNHILQYLLNHICVQSHGMNEVKIFFIIIYNHN